MVEMIWVVGRENRDRTGVVVLVGEGVERSGERSKLMGRGGGWAVKVVAEVRETEG